ncbi:MAG: protein kinase domain-containing protein [Planctomycetota bacterium]|jgi:serine/threonine protein kinase/Flp pilus assembly protein TadD
MEPEDFDRLESSSSDDSGKFDTHSQPVFAPIEALIGTDLGHYHIVDEIGRGSMGVVFEAAHKITKQSVALKVLPPHISGSDKVIRRFLREAESVAKLNHPNIVKIYDIGQKASLYFYAMELIDGDPLDEILKAGSLPTFKRVGKLMAQACEAVHFAHQHHIIHRDIKPGNIIVEQGDKVVITDFGLARQEKAATLTESGALVGTPIYMSPEQVIGKRGGVDPRTDIYSLGVTLYQMLAGYPPFQSESTQRILNLILEEEPVPPKRQRSHVPRPLSIIAMKAIEKDPDQRFQTAQEMGEELKRYLRGASIRSKPAGMVTRAMKRVKRHKVISVLAALSLLLALLFVIQAIYTSMELESSKLEQETRVVEERARVDKYYQNVQIAMDFLAHPSGLGVNLNTTVALLKEAVQLFPERPEAHFYLGKIYSMQGNNRDALLEFTEAIQYGPDFSEAYMERALILMEQGKLHKHRETIDLGITDLQTALSLDSENPKVIHVMAKTLYDGSAAEDLRIEERKQMLTMALNFAMKAQVLETSADLECLLAQIYLEFAKDATSKIERSTNLQSALTCLTKALEMDPDHALAGPLADEVQRMVEAPNGDLAEVDAWEFIKEQGLAGSLTHADQLYDMVMKGVERTWSETEKTQILETVANFLLSPDPVDPMVNLATQQIEAAADSELNLDYAGLLDKASEYSEQGNHSAAIRCYEKARVLNPTKAHELNYNIAEVYYEQEELGLALQHARLAYTQDPTSLPYVELLGRLLQELGDTEGFGRLYREAEKNGKASLLGWELPAPEDKEDKGAVPAPAEPVELVDPPGSLPR